MSEEKLAGCQFYTYQGEPILDIQEWAKRRGERLISYKRTVKGIDMFSGKVVEKVTYGKMPETFWSTLRIGPNEKFEEVKAE